MQKFSRYKKDKIAHFHKDNNLSVTKTINKFWITYKELYKIIDKSRIFNYQVIDSVPHKKCSSCWSFKPHNESCFYTRKWTKYYYSACKYCMKLLSTTYRIIHKKNLYVDRKEYYKDYNIQNKNSIKERKSKYYKRYKNNILANKKASYMKKKRKFLKHLLFKLK